ncbi:hypothetical protein LCGC14_1322420 [marine sediment metagenome]|uniref:Uncharacterized protein n=1 Tax=marine sediment metagenome TaxID=412755 RepID=A0A0F9KJ42_9ZZZZ
MNTDLAWAIRDGVAAAPCTCDWKICDRCDMLRRLAHLQYQDAFERERFRCNRCGHTCQRQHAIDRSDDHNGWPHYGCPRCEHPMYPLKQRPAPASARHHDASSGK